MTRCRLAALAITGALLFTPTAHAAFPTDKPTKKLTIVELLSTVDGAQALVGAVLYLDSTGVLDFSVAELLNDKKTRAILFAPTNDAFETLLGLDPGSLDGLTPQQIQAALASLVTGEALAPILLTHVVLDQKAKEKDGAVNALLVAGSANSANGTALSFGMSSAGVEVNDIPIVRGDVRVRNGIVNFIGAVIVPESSSPSGAFVN